MSDFETDLSDGLAATEKEIFSEATAKEAPKPAPTEQLPSVNPPGEITPQPRDDAGRFASKEAPAPAPEAPTPEPAAAPPEPEDRQDIPQWRLREEAEAKREAIKRAEAAEADRQRYEAELHALRQQVQSLQPKPAPVEVPDPLVDPQGYRAHFERQIEDRLLNQQRELDMRLAHRTHGQVFEQAFAEAQSRIARGDNQLMAMLQNTSSPGESLVQWFKREQVTREVGDNPTAWLEKKLEERLNDPAFLAKAMEKAREKATANPPSKPAVSLPPSLSSMSPAMAQVSDPDADDNSDEAVFRQAFRR